MNRFAFRLLPALASATILVGAAANVRGAQAAELHPIEARSIVMGPVSGVAYYTAEAAGDRVVATLSAAAGAQPIRVVAMLTPGQSMTLSVPRGAGEPAIEVAFTRRGDRVFVTDAAVLTN